MKANPTELGRVVISTHGHDAGRYYAVIGVEADMALLCDGERKTLSKPKRKRMKHLRALPLTIAVTGKGGSGGAVVDGDIRKALKLARNMYEARTMSAHDAARHDKEECAFVQE